jgi:hypothetical protein
MTRPGAADGPKAALKREGELTKTCELLGSKAALGLGAALRHAGMFESGGALLFAHPIAHATISGEPALVKRSRGPRRLLDDPGFVVFAASTALHCARIGILAGDLSMAEEELRRAYHAFTGIGERYLLAPLAALLAEVVSARGCLVEAEEFSRAAQELASSDDELQALWPSPRGKVLAWQEHAHYAECRAREALDLIRMRAALSRLTAACWRSTSADGFRSPSDRGAWNGGGRAAPRITERLAEHAEHIVEVFVHAIEDGKLYIDDEGGVHVAPAHAVCLHAAIAAIEQAYGRVPQAQAPS